MRRSSRRRRSSIEVFFRRVILVLAVLIVAMIGLAILANEQPVVAVASLAGGIAFAVWFWSHKRRARREEARMRVLQAQSLGDLLTVSGADFESIVAELFRSLGYRDVERIGGSGDLGVDLTATDPDGFSVLIQCKRYGRGNKVGSPAIQNLMGAVVNRGADLGIFVTTSVFTAPAIQLAATGRVPITLIDGDAITRLAVQTASASERPTEYRAGATQPTAAPDNMPADRYSAVI